MDEFCVINLKTDSTIDSIEHELNDALVIRGEIVPTPPASCTIDRTLGTSIDTTLGPLLGSSGEVLYSERNLESRVKRIVRHKHASRS